MKPTINVPYVGCHVWSGPGHPSHGPEHGPKVAIPPETRGEIVSIQQQYAAPSLITVRWGDRTVSGHYFYELDCIGPFESPEEYVSSFRHARNAQLWLGPRGGFQQFTAEVRLGCLFDQVMAGLMVRG